MSGSFSSLGTNMREGAPEPARVPRSEWLLLLAAAIVAIPLWRWRGNTSGAGATVMARITLVTSDRDDLACASPRVVNGYRCAFEKDTGVQRAPAAKWLAPYMTESHQMFLLPELFNQTSLKVRYEKEPPTTTPRSALRRFTAVCKLRLIEKVSGVQVRWVKSDPMSPPDNTAWVAEPLACKVEG